MLYTFGNEFGLSIVMIVEDCHVLDNDGSHFVVCTPVSKGSVLHVSHYRIEYHPVCLVEKKGGHAGRAIHRLSILGVTLENPEGCFSLTGLGI
jgi:hypothetical protein